MNARLQETKRSGRLFYRAIMKKKWWMLVISTIFLFVLGGCIAVMITSAHYNLDSLKNLPLTTTVYDHDKKPVTGLGNTQKEYVELNKVKSQELIDTYTAVEEERFRNHKQGASTITQQVARKLILNDNDKQMMKIMWKVNEIAIAYNLERKYTQEQILEAYLNYVYLGNGTRGIQLASKIYFNKDLTKDRLEPHEIALLAGLPKAPEGDNPYTHPEKAKFRRDAVLNKMAEKQLITKTEAEEYKKKKLGVNKEYLQEHDKYQAYKDILIKEAEARYGLDPKELIEGGYKIYSGINAKAQLALEKTLRNDTFYKGHEKLDGAATMIDTKTGRIVAIGGGRKYLPGYRNQAIKAKMQPGSSIKPLTVFAPAVEEKGFSSSTRVSDAPFTCGAWSVRNPDDRYHGTPTLKEMAARSLNVSTARLLVETVGVETGFKYAEKLGLQLQPEDKAPAPLALGGTLHGVNTVQMAQAYATFPNQGKLNEAHTIEKIVDVDGDEVKPKEKRKTNQKVFSPQTASTMNDILKYVVTNGSGSNAALADGRDMAGKTGITQSSKAAWFVGYTQEYVMATTVFNDQGSNVDLYRGEYPARIFNEVMGATLRGTKVSRFDQPTPGSEENNDQSPPASGPEPEEPRTPVNEDPPTPEPPPPQPPPDNENTGPPAPNG